MASPTLQHVCTGSEASSSAFNDSGSLLEGFWLLKQFPKLRVFFFFLLKHLILTPEVMAA